MFRDLYRKNKQISNEECVEREVLEETGLHINIFEDFSSTSEYKIAGRVEKRVTIFLASTSDTSTVIQQEEIEDRIAMFR